MSLDLLLDSGLARRQANTPNQRAEDFTIYLTPRHPVRKKSRS